MKSDPVWTAECARKIDKLSIETYKISQSELMERAGTAVANVAASSPQRKSFLVLAGTGNNGGDALVAARVLAANPNHQVITVRVGKTPVRIPEGIRFDCIIDGIFGIGFRGPLDPTSPAAQLLQDAAQIRVRDGAIVIAVDLPSGLDCDNSGQTETVLSADETVTFGGMKAVHAVAPGRDLCGKVHCVDIGFSNAAVEEALSASAAIFSVVRGQELIADNPWSRLGPSAHKYTRGHILVAGGSTGKTGAPVLTAMASLRSGAGWATISTPTRITSSVNTPPDLTCEPLWANGRGATGLDAKKLEAFIHGRKVRAVVVGPGTMENPLNIKSLSVLCDFSNDGFVVIDAAALHGILELLRKSQKQFRLGRVILTPHPGEWKLLSTGQGSKRWPAPLNSDAVMAVERECADVGLHIVYKHSTPVLCGPLAFDLDGARSARALVFNEGTNAMGRAGTGDVLAGCIAAHGAIGCDAAMATMRALAVVSSAARLAANQVGQHAVLASDIIAMLGKV